MTKVGITMPCINLWDKYTRPAIDSVFKAMDESTKHDIESSLLLIDNGSTDNTQEQVKALTRKDLVYKRNDDMWNFQETVNFGWDKWFSLDVDIVLTLNNDILLHQDAIWRLVERFKKGDVDMVTCMDVKGQCTRPDHLFEMTSQEYEDVEEAPH